MPRAAFQRLCRLPDYAARRFCGCSDLERSLICAIARRGIITDPPRRQAASLLAGNGPASRPTVRRAPVLEHRDDIRAQRRASHLATLSETADVGAYAELYVLTPERCELRIPEARLNGQEQKSSVAPSDPCIEIGSCYKSGALFFGEEC